MTVIDEKLYVLGNAGRYLAIGTHSRIIYNADRRETAGLYVYTGVVDNEQTLDLTAPFSLPWPAESHYVNECRMALDQKILNAEEEQRRRRQLELYAKPAVSLASRICVAANHRAFISIGNSSTHGDGVWEHREHHAQRVYRLVDCLTGDVLFERFSSNVERPKPGFKSMFDLAREMKSRPKPHPNGAPVAIDPEAQTALFAAHDGYQIVALDGDLTLLVSETTHMLGNHSHGAWCAGKYVVSYQFIDKNGLLVIDPASGRVDKMFSFGAAPVNSLSAATERPQVVCGLYGGQMYLVDIHSGNIIRYRPHRGITDGWGIDARLSANAALIASCVDERLCMTDPAAGKTYSLMPLERVVHKDNSAGAGRLVYNPDFNFSGERLLILRQKKVTVRSAPELDSVVHAYVSDLRHPAYQKPHRFSSRLGLTTNCEKSGLGRIAATLATIWSQPLKIGVKSYKRPLPVGESRFGGVPDLPKGMTWPHFENKPLAFIGQLNLAPIAVQLPNSPLPKQGLLSFFIADGEYIFNMDETNVGDEPAWRVFYFSDPDRLSSTAHCVPPSEEIVTYPQTALKFSKKGAVLPALDALPIANLQLSDIEAENYLQLIKQLPEPQFGHQLLGYPALIQNNDLEMECELFARRRDPYRRVPKDDPDYAAIHQAAADWVLLLQLDSDNLLNWLWGDAGMLYWLIRRDDLAARNFENTWLIPQCH